MSRSNPTAKNPATRFMRWEGGAENGGQLTWYDKENEETKVIALPFTFLVLDELTTISGFSEPDHSGFWSNEIKSLNNEELVVRTKSGIKARGLYSKISDNIKSMGAKYAQSVYVAFKDESGEMVIGNIKMVGSSLTAWIEFKKKFNVLECAVMLTGAAKAKKGSNTYFTPIFEGRTVQAGTQQVANQLDETLQAYLSNYMARKPEIGDVEEVDDEPVIEDIDPVEAVEQAEAKPAEKEETPAQVEAKDGVNLSDVPF